MPRKNGPVPPTGVCTDAQVVQGDQSTNALPVHLHRVEVPLPAGWIWDRLDRICSGIFDCPHSTPLLTTSGPFVARSQDIKSGVLRLNEVAHVSEETYRERTARAVPGYGDLLYSREGTYFGVAAEVPEGARICLGQRMVLLRPNPERVYFRYLRYWLNSPIVTAFLMGHRDGSVAERLNLPTIRGICVAMPPVPMQQAIADILGALDDKIELNRRMSETLEAMARALFKSWFVDFDPVRAKAEGRDPGLPNDLIHMFPAALDSDGKPRGWRTLLIGRVAHNHRDSVQPGEMAETCPYIGLEHMPRGRITLPEWGLAKGLGSAKFRFGRGDILFGKLRPYFRKVGIAPTDGICSTDVLVVRPINPQWFGFLIGHLSSEEFVQYTTSGSTGTRMPRTDWNHMSRYPVVTPPDQLVAAFNRMVEPLVLKTIACVYESRVLTALRDTLLPKLISGEIRVGQAKAMAKAAGV